MSKSFRFARGSVLGTAVLAIASVAGIGVAGYSALTGATVCSIFACDGDKTATPAAATTTTVATTAAASEEKSCCALKAAAARVAQASNKTCSESKEAATVATTIAATETTSESGCCKAKAAKAAAVNASATECSSTKTACEKSGEAKVVNAANADAAASGCCKDKAAKATAVNASASECSKATAVNASAGECSKATTVNAASVEASGCCKAKAAQAVNAANTEGCAAKATAVNASATGCTASKASCDKAGVVKTASAPMNVSWRVVLAGGAPVVLPVFTYDCGTVAADCSVASLCSSTLSVKSCGTAAKATTVSAGGCPFAAQAVNAANVEAKACKHLQDGCTGSGENGCCGKCADEKKATPANATEADKVAARE